MKKILIPTDFTEESLSIISNYVIDRSEKEVSVLFFSGIKLSDSITDLLLLSRRTREVELIPKSFTNYCDCIQNEFSSVVKVRFEYFYGNTMALFRNFLDANEIDEIVYDPGITFRKITKSSLDIIDIINRSSWKKWTPASGRKPVQDNVAHEEAIALQTEGIYL